MCIASLDASRESLDHTIGAISGPHAEEHAMECVVDLAYLGARWDR